MMHLTPEQRARLQRDFETMNAPRIRSDRMSTALLVAAWALAGACAVLLFTLIARWALARAAEAAAMAPTMMLF